MTGRKCNAVNNRELKKMIIPLFWEQLLVLLVGIADTLVMSAVWNGLIFAATPLLMHAYALEAETKTLVIQLVFIHNLFNAVVYPFSGAMSSGLRAAGDVKFTTIVSIGATVIGRLTLSYILGSVCGMGVIGIALAMCFDWLVQAVLFIWRLRSGRWKRFRVV